MTQIQSRTVFLLGSLFTSFLLVILLLVFLRGAVVAHTTIANEPSRSVANGALENDQFIAQPDLVINADYQEYMPWPGKRMTYTVRYSNQGNTNTSGVFITAVQAPETIFDASASDPGWVSLGNGHFRYDVGDLNFGDSGEILFVVTLSNSFIATGITNFDVRFEIQDDGQSGPDSVPGNNVFLAPLGIPNLVIDRAVVDPPVRVGEPGWMTVTVRNTGLGLACGIFNLPPPGCSQFAVDLFIDPTEPPQSYPINDFGTCYAFSNPIAPGQSAMIPISFTTDSDLGNSSPGFCKATPISKIWLKADNWSIDSSPNPAEYGLVPESNENDNLFGPMILGFTIWGRVTDANNNPIADVTISASSGGSTTTDADGYYTINGLSAGTYTLAPSKSGYSFSPASRSVSVPPNATGQDFTAQMTTDRPPIVFVHGWHGWPPWGSCEQAEPDSYFETVDQDLLAENFSVAYAYLESSPCFTPSLIENVPNLKSAIENAKAATGQEKVILVAHSMGGLVSRAYIEGQDYADDVAALFTFGSPHHGVPEDLVAFLANGISLGKYCEDIQPAVCDFSILGMVLFNQDHQPRSDVTYHLISGNAPFFSRSLVGKLFDRIIAGSDDGGVPTQSGIGRNLPNSLDRWQTDEVHGTVFGSRTYFIRDGGQSKSYKECLKTVLVDKTSDTCGSASTLQRSADPTLELAQRTPFEHGTLLAGQITTRTLSLEGYSTLFAAHWQTGTLAITLVDPNNQTIDPVVATVSPHVVSYESEGTSAMYYFTTTIAGTWQMVLEAGSDVPPEGSGYFTFVAFESPLTLRAGTDRVWYRPGAAATISASLTGAVTSATVTATVLHTETITETLNLSMQDAGQYQAMYTVPNAPGYAEVRLVATGTTTDGVPFERGANLIFQVSPSSFDLNGVYSDKPQSRSPGSPFYESLIVAVGINAASSGTVGLSADLEDTSGNFVAHSLAIQDVATGTHTLSLRFDGKDIFGAQRNGPYILTNLLLTDRRGVILVVVEGEDVHTTAAYDYGSFAPPSIFLPVILRHY